MSSESVAWILTVVFGVMWLKVALQKFFLLKAMREGVVPAMDLMIGELRLPQREKDELYATLNQLRRLVARPGLD